MIDKSFTHIVDLRPENLRSKEFKFASHITPGIFSSNIISGCWVIHTCRSFGIKLATIQLTNFSDLENIKTVPKNENPNFFSLPDIKFNSLRVFKKKTVSFYLPNTLALYRTSNKRIKFSKVLLNKIYSSRYYGYCYHEYLNKTEQILVIAKTKEISRVNRKSLKIKTPLTLNTCITVRPPPVISNCEKYFIVLVQNMSIQIYSLVDKCKTNRIIQFDFDIMDMVLGRTYLYILQNNWEIITIINIIDFLENKKKQNKKKGANTIKNIKG